LREKSFAARLRAMTTNFAKNWWWQVR